MPRPILLLLVSVFVLSPITQAHAYIGPGVGVSLLGSLIGLLAMLGLAAWGLLRWAFRSVFSFGGSGRGAVAAAGPGAPAIETARPAPARGQRAGRGSAMATRLIYLGAGILIASFFSTPRDITMKWLTASAHIVRGFSDPVSALHAKPARVSPDVTGVRVYEPALAWRGINLELSGGALSARLLDMRGQEVHRWQLETAAMDRAWAAMGEPIGDLSGFYWRRAKPLPDGSLLVIVENKSTTPYGLGMVKLDWESNVVWMTPARYHHSLDVGPDGRIYVLYQELAEDTVHGIDWIEPPFLDEGVAILDPDGTELDRISVVAAFADTPFESYLRKVQMNVRGDPLHMNTVSVVTPEEAARSTIAREGQLLVSIRDMDTVAVIDPGTRKVVWAESGLWAHQHEPVLTSGSNVLIFDNHGPGDATSRAIEWDTSTKEMIWQWAGTPDMPLWSDIYGSIEALPNGNRLVSETLAARAVEVTPDGRVAWEWLTDRRTGEDDGEILPLMEMQRLPADFFTGRGFIVANAWRMRQ